MRAAMITMCLSLGLVAGGASATTFIVPPPDPRALAAAQDMVGAFPIDRGLRPVEGYDWDGVLKRLHDDVSDCLWAGLPAPPSSSIRPMFDAKVADAVRARVGDGEIAIRDAVIERYARLLPADQLEQISAFVKTPAGKGLVTELARSGELFSATASREFCRLLWPDKVRLLSEANESEPIRTRINARR
jgi:hypothetical protein